MIHYVCVTSVGQPENTPLINMASILSLPNDCLFRIVSCIDDPSSFYSIALTCQRLLQVTENTRSVLHTNILRKKAEYFIKRYIVQLSRITDNDYMIGRRDSVAVKYDKLRDLLRDSARLTAAKGILTYDKVIDIWQRNGPVATKLFTWIRHLESNMKGTGIPTSFKENRSVTLHLPNCRKSMVIESSYFGNHSHVHDRRHRIHVMCGDLDVISEGFTLSPPKDYMSWTKAEVRGAVEPKKAVLELLQKELGKTVPPITDHFFIWLCYFFPDQSNLLEQNRLSFKDPARNRKPSPGSVQTAIDEFSKDQQFESNFQKLVTRCRPYEKYEWHESRYPDIIAETIHILAQRSEAKIIERLEEDASRFHEIATYYDLKNLSRRFLLDLLLRTSLEASTYKPVNIANKYVESRVLFKCLGGKVMTVSGSIHGDGDRYPNWEKLELQFTLPDGKVLKLEGPLEIENLSPVTALLEECVNQMEPGKSEKIGNFRTAVYFLHALEFSAASYIAFNSLTPLSRYPESEEEYWSSEETEFSWRAPWRDDY